MNKNITIFIWKYIKFFAVLSSFCFYSDSGINLKKYPDPNINNNNFNYTKSVDSNYLKNFPDSSIIVTSITEYPIPDNAVINGVRVISRDNIFASTDHSILHFNGKKWKILYRSVNLIQSADSDGEFLVFSIIEHTKFWKSENIFASKILYNGNDVQITKPENKIFNLILSYQNRFIHSGCIVLIGENECCIAYLKYNSLKNKIIVDQKNYPLLPPQSSYFGTGIKNSDFQRKKEPNKFIKINLLLFDGNQDPSLTKAELKNDGFIYKTINIKNNIDEKYNTIQLSGSYFPNINNGILTSNIGIIIYDGNDQKNQFLIIKSPIQASSNNNESILIPTGKIISICMTKNNEIFGLTEDGNIIMGSAEPNNWHNVKWKIIGKTDQNLNTITPINSSDEILLTGNNSCIVKITNESNDSKKKIDKSEYENINSDLKIFTIADAFSGSIYGITIADYNNDDNEDIYLVDMLTSNYLVIPNKNDISSKIGTLFGVNVAGEHGLSGRMNPKFVNHLENFDLGVVSGDINEDGNKDILVSQLYGPNSLYMNNGKGFFRDATINFNLDINIKRSEGIVLADINNDGYLDILMLSFLGKNRLFLNKNGVEFEDITYKSGLDTLGTSLTAVFGDINGDGYPDLYIGNWVNENKMYINNGKKGFDGELPVFHDLTKESGTGCGILKKTNSVLFADFNNDGYLDLFVGNRANPNRLFLNDGSAHFIDVSYLINKDIYGNDSVRLYTYGSVFADFDNDGWQDIFFANVEGIKLYKNLGNKLTEKLSNINSQKSMIKFIDATHNLFIENNYYNGFNTGVATLDYEKDGDFDIIVGQREGFAFLLKNLLNNPNEKKKNFIEVKISGSKSNRDGIGAKLRLFKINTDDKYKGIDQSGDSGSSGNMIAYREVSSAYGYASSISKIQHFGIADTLAKYELEVEFPASGIKKRMPVEPGSFIEVKEYEGIEELYYLTLKNIRRFIFNPDNKRVMSEFLLLNIILFVLVFVKKNYIFKGNLIESFGNVKISSGIKIKIIAVPIFIYILIFFIFGYLINFFLGDSLWISNSSSFEVVEIFKEIISFGSACAAFYFVIKYERDKIFKSVIGFEIQDKLYNMLRQFQHGESMMMNLNRLAFFSENIKSILVEADFNISISNNIKLIVERYDTAVEEYNKFVDPQIISITKILDIFERTNNNESLLKTGNKISINLLESNEDLKLSINRSSLLIKNIISERNVNESHLIQMELFKNKVLENTEKIKMITGDTYRVIGRTIECTVDDVIKTTIKKFSSDDQVQKYYIEYLRGENNTPLKAKIPSIGLNEILSILIQNSFEAFSMQEVNIGSNRISNNKLKISLQVYLVNNKINIAVEDNGPGIPSDISEEIFKDGFTTKQGNRGFGLAYAKSQLEKHGGLIKCVPSQSKGTRFVIELFRGGE